MAVVGWLEAGGALRISPRFFESASWIRFERSCSILYGEEDARPEEDVGGVFFAAAAGATGRGAEEAFGDGGVLRSRQPGMETGVPEFRIQGGGRFRADDPFSFF